MSKSPIRNQRRSSRKQIRQQNLLEVTVRSAKAAEQRNRWLVTWSCVLILVAMAIGGIYYGVREGLRRFLWENPDYDLAEVEISTDGSLAREQVLEVTEIRQGMNIFRINIWKAREKLTELPQVDVAEIQRTLPNKITIHITERKPIAWIAAKYDEDPTVYASSYLVDARGTLMKSKNQLSEYFHLPVIYGVPTENFEQGQVISTPEVKAALDLVRLNSDDAAQARFQARSIDVSKGYCLVVTDRSHACITFGLEHLDLQMERLMMVLDHIEQNKREMQTVNLMVQRNVPVTFVEQSIAPVDGSEPLPGSEGTAENPKPNPTPPASLKKPELPKASSASKAKRAIPVKRAEPVRSKSKESKPVKRAIPVNSQNKLNG